jgi:uncharacterized protein (DUF3084 family)
VQTKRIDQRGPQLAARGEVTAKERGLSEFVEAVLAFSDDPGANLERYLAASRALEKPAPDGRAQ